MRRRSIELLAGVLAAWIAAALPALAQVTTATVTGTVKDAQGAIIPGAAVILVSETRGTRLPEVFTNAEGDFTFANVSPDRYTVQVTIEGFKTLKRTGLVVSAGDRTLTGALAIEVGGVSDTVQVRAEAPLVQAQSGERSYTVSREAVENLPIANRSFTALAFLAPGVTNDANNTPTRIGGGGDPNIMMDGVSTMDTGSNRPLLQMNVESIAEVKVLTSNYQAEYGRSSGVQVTAVTKSGTNQFRGSLYDVERDSDWNSNTKVNKLNGDPKAVLKERDWGYSLGGPIGKPGGANKLFFFYSQEFAPRTAGNNIVRYRMPTALERAGDFSQSTDNNGALYPYIKDPLSAAACSATVTAGCFQDGGVLGRIPANRLYQPGLNILRQYPLPNMANVPALQNYNFELTRPEESILSTQPALRFDYQPLQNLRATFKLSAWSQRDHTFNGTIPGYNDTRMQNAPVFSYTTSVNYTLSPTMFLEATYGHSQNELAGCAQAQSGTGAIFCNNAAGSQGVAVTPNASLAGSNLQDLPFLFPNATVLDQNYYAVQALNELSPAFWDGTRISKIPSFTWGGRVANAPPTIGFPGWFNINSTHDFSSSLTKVMGRHTFKTGIYYTHSYKAEQTSNNAFGTINFQQDAVGTNQFDTSFGFANAATGAFSSYLQAQKYVETSSVYSNTEAYIQDNWKASSRLTFDYGLRFVHQAAQYDKLGQASNFLPEQWSLGAAPALYVAGCLGASPCSGSNRVAVNPLTGSLAGREQLAGDWHPGAGHRKYPERSGAAGRRHSPCDLQVAGDRGRAAVRDGLRPHRSAEDRSPRRRRAVLRSALHDDHLGRREQSAHVRDDHRAVRAAAGARRRLDDRRRAGTLGARIRRAPAVLDAVERRGAVRAALGGRARPVVCRPAWLPHLPGRQPERGRLRRRLPAAEPGSDARREHDAWRDRDLDQSAPRDSRLRRDHPAVGPRLADLSLDPNRLQSPLPRRPGVRLQRHHRVVRSAAGRRPAPAQS